MKTDQAPTKKRSKHTGRPGNQNYRAKRFAEFIDSIPYCDRSLFLSKLQVALEVTNGTVRKFFISDFIHTLPNRIAINELAGKDIYANPKQE